MPIINKGTSFSNGEQLTADKINNLLELATFNQSATDSTSTTVNSASQIIVRDSGVTTAKLATDAVETAKIASDAVTTAKILDANVTTAKIADANVTFAKLTDVIDDDTMATATNTTLATSESIKAYVDSLTTIKAHCVWDPALTGTNAPISGSGVTSVTRNSAGNWTINLSVTAPLSNFVTLVSSDTSSSGSINTATGAYSTSTTTVSVTREGSNGVGYDGSNPISFTAIW